VASVEAKKGKKPEKLVAEPEVAQPVTEPASLPEENSPHAEIEAKIGAIDYKEVESEIQAEL
jgi:hypothetical protein